MAQRHARYLSHGDTHIPEDAIRLIEDIQTLNQILNLLGNISDRSIAIPRPDYAMSVIEARQMLRRVGFLVSGMHSVAQDNMRYEYLAGKRMAPKHRRQTLADVWQDVINI